MALAGADQAGHPVVSRGEDFLLKSVREDGSWPIDTNLATWTTTLATKALLGSSGSPSDFSAEERKRTLDWLLAQQYRTVHPFTVSPPGGWAWTDLSGGVPDADDTAGALLAIHRLGRIRPEVQEAARAGINWLLGLQNRDGGIPTFCRGWGALPFDRSSPDISAHALRALTVWRQAWDGAFGERIDKARHAILRYLGSRQEQDGSWSPLWFGNQYLQKENNRTYGTAIVLIALADEEESREAVTMREKGLAWLRSTQSPEGGWSGGDPAQPSSIEETALALRALADDGLTEQVKKGVKHLAELTENGRRFPPSPIGFYFAKLWYWERLYPVVWTVEALEALSHQTKDFERGAATS
jgi:squalene-hopene/tetraprenyl-beta-curcumene cyclase